MLNKVSSELEGCGFSPFEMVGGELRFRADWEDNAAQ